MDGDGDEDGLLNIYVFDTEDDPVAKKAQRTDQTEEDFQVVKRTYGAKIENGEIYRSIQLPLKGPLNKLHLQELLHAVEELYFFRRFQEALDFLNYILHGESLKALDNDTTLLLQKYETRCQQRLATTS